MLTLEAKKVPTVWDFQFEYDNEDEENNTLRHCCGVIEIGDFVCTARFDWDNIPAEVLQGIKERFRNLNRMLIATTTETTSSQLNAATVLTACGWTRVSDYINPNSGNRVILWNFTP